MARILSRYLLREIVFAWLAVTTVLLVVLLTNQLASVLARAAEGGFPREVVLHLVGLGTVRNLAVLLPLAALGVVLALAGAAVQVRRRSRIRLVWEFDHNGIFHLLQTAGLIVIWVGLGMR